MTDHLFNILFIFVCIVGVYAILLALCIHAILAVFAFGFVVYALYTMLDDKQKHEAFMKRLRSH